SRGLELRRVRRRCRTAGRDRQGTGAFSRRRPDGEPAPNRTCGAGRARRRTSGGDGRGRALPNPPRAQLELVGRTGVPLSHARVPISSARPAVAEPGTVTKPRAVAVARPIAIAGSLASERRSRGWGRAVDGPPCRLNAVRENGNPAVRLLAVTLRADAGLLLERDVDNPSLVGLHRVHHDPLTRAPDPISQPERHFLDRLFTPVSVVLDVDHQPAPVRSTLVEDQVDDRLERP